MTPTPGALLVAFKRMSPRAVQVIEKAALDRLLLAELARHYGVTEQAAGVLVMRAVRELDLVLLGQAASPLSFEAELATLPEFLDGWARGSSTGPAATLGATTALREELKASLAAAAAAEANSPRRRYEGWLRWVAIVAIVALSAYLYWRDEARQAPIAGPRATPRSSRRRAPSGPTRRWTHTARRAGARGTR